MHSRSWRCFALLLAAVAGCDGGPPKGAPATLKGLALELEALGADASGKPESFRLTFKNSTSAPISFQEPSPMCPEEMREGLTRLGLVLTDSSGRESQWTPILTELFQANLSEPRTRTLAPGESWSQTYDLDSLYFWGPCGPGAPISEALVPGPAATQVQAVIAVSQDSLIRSQPLQISWGFSKWLFDEPGTPRVEDDSKPEEGGAKDAASRREVGRRRAAALRALQRVASRAGKEPEHEGKPVSHWIERYCDPASRFSEDDEPAAAPRRQAIKAIIDTGTPAVPVLMEAIKLEDELGDCAVDLLRVLFEAGKVPEQVLVAALKSGSERARRGVLEALDPEGSGLEGRRGRATFSQTLVDAIVELLHDREFIIGRYMAPRALGRPGLKAAVPGLMEALKDGDSHVRGRAIRALAMIGREAREAIPALESIARESSLEARVARSALRALGEEVPETADFFDRMEAYFHRRSAKEPVKESTEAVLDRLPAGGDGVFFVVDRSGTSMPGVRFSQRYIPRVLSSLGEDTEFGIVFVDRQALSHPEGGKPAKAGREEKAAALGFVLTMEGGSGSCPEAGFRAALELTASSGAKRKAIVYIGDGGGTCQGEREPEYLERMCAEVTRMNTGRAEIHAIGVDAGPLGEAVLLYLTERNGGTYTRLVQ